MQLVGKMIPSCKRSCYDLLLHDVLEAIIRTKSIHLVSESEHLSESRNFTMYGCGKLTYVINNLIIATPF